MTIVLVKIAANNGSKRFEDIVTFRGESGEKFPFWRSVWVWVCVVLIICGAPLIVSRLNADWTHCRCANWFENLYRALQLSCRSQRPSKSPFLFHFFILGNEKRWESVKRIDWKTAAVFWNQLLKCRHLRIVQKECKQIQSTFVLSGSI